MSLSLLDPLLTLWYFVLITLSLLFPPFFSSVKLRPITYLIPSPHTTLQSSLPFRDLPNPTPNLPPPTHTHNSLALHHTPSDRWQHDRSLEDSQRHSSRLHHGRELEPDSRLHGWLGISGELFGVCEKSREGGSRSTCCVRVRTRTRTRTRIS